MVELLLSVAVFGFLVTGLTGAIVYGRASTADAGDHQRAVFLAEEGIEATRNIAAASYANLVNGTFGVVQTGNQWVLSGASDVTDTYTRQVVIGTAGTNRKSITATVTWPQANGGTGTVTITSQLVNWPAATKLWTNAIVAGSTNVTGTNNGIKTYTVGNFAYTVLNATTNNLVITNISNPAAPVNVSTTTLAGTPTNIYVSGIYAYITNTSDTAELQVVDISVPATPVLKASVNMIGTGNGQGVYVSGNFAYVSRIADATTNAFELTIVNITAPLTPVVSGGFNSTLSYNEVYVSGTNAYVATSSTATEMQVIGVTNPAAPTLVASYNAPTATTALAISGFANTILLGTGTTLNLVNVTTPASPASLGSFTATGVINDVDEDITNKYAFLGTAGTAAEFQVVNITTPATPALAKTVDVTGTTSTVAGVSYNSSLDVVVGTTASDTQEITVFTRN
jgi:Tfp pilus assembly protein PilV